MTKVEREIKKIINRIRRNASLTVSPEDYCGPDCAVCVRWEANRRILRRLSEPS